MIHKISINNYGSLINFSNDQNEFTSMNAVIHGMNGSGKSQICSILRQIEKINRAKLLEPNNKKDEEKSIIQYIGTRLSKETVSKIVDVKIDKYSVSIDTANNRVTENGDTPDIFIFNEDYVNENIGDFLKIQDKEIRIGQKNVSRDNLIKERQVKEIALKKINDEIDKIINEARIESTYPKQQRTQEIINKENYLKETNPGESFPEAKEQLNKLSTPPELIIEHQRFNFPLLELDDKIKKSIIEIMSKTYIEPKITQEFYKLYLSVKKSFYEDGISIYNDYKNICPFCLTPKSEDDPIIKELLAYLYSDYNETVNSIQNIVNIFVKKKNDLESFLTNWNTIVLIIKDKMKALSMSGEVKEIVIDVNVIDGYIDLLKNKIINMNKIHETKDLFEIYDLHINNINNSYLDHIKIINNVNEEINKISGLKRSLGEKIIKNQMYMLWEKNRAREAHEILSDEITKLKIEIENTSTLISNNRIPDFFNQIIKILGITKYELSQESYLFLKLDNDFNISKEGYRISAGERKIIGYSYFLAEVLASAGSNAELLQKTVIIDDPVDSSDYDKFYSFISVIENFDNILTIIYKNKEIKFGQILIFTHSALLYERFVNSQKLDHYHLLMENNKTKIEKQKKKISLATFSSYIKKISNYIKSMKCSNTKDIGNYIRRVLEIICSVENIDSNTITNLNASSKLNALANHLSHESIERILDPLPISYEYIEACIELIEEIQRRMPYLYNSIVEKYLGEKEIEYYRNEYNKKYLSNP